MQILIILIKRAKQLCMWPLSAEQLKGQSDFFWRLGVIHTLKIIMDSMFVIRCRKANTQAKNIIRRIIEFSMFFGQWNVKVTPS
jgi:hypothetical protein